MKFNYFYFLGFKLKKIELKIVPPPPWQKIPPQSRDNSVVSV